MATGRIRITTDLLTELLTRGCSEYRYVSGLPSEFRIAGAGLSDDGRTAWLFIDSDELAGGEELTPVYEAVADG